MHFTELELERQRADDCEHAYVRLGAERDDLVDDLHALKAVNADLLAACEALIKADHGRFVGLRMSDSEMAAIKAIKAAIAKARGAASARREDA